MGATMNSAIIIFSGSFLGAGAGTVYWLRRTVKDLLDKLEADDDISKIQLVVQMRGGSHD